MKILKKIVSCLLVFQASVFIYAEVSFGNLNLNSDDNLLFTSYQNIPGSVSYNSLFVAHLEKQSVSSTPKILTCFPEQMELLENGKILQIRNRFGKALYNESEDKLVWTQFADRIPVEYSKLSVMSVSPDGKWLCYVKRVKSSVGQLILKNANSGEEKILVDSTPFSYDRVCVKWAPDSSAVLYENKGEIFFTTPSTSLIDLKLPEQYCKIGKGSIDSVQWTDERSIILIDKDIVYKISQNELYTRGLYSSLVGIGKIAGRLHVSFDANHDRFWCDSEGNQLVIINGDKVLTHYVLPVSGINFAEVKTVLTLTGFGGSFLDSRIFWSSENVPFLWIDMLLYENGQKFSSVYSISQKLNLILSVKGSLEPKLSSDKHLLAFTGGNSIYVYNTSTWKQVSKLTDDKIISFVWKDKQSLYIGGTQTVKIWSFNYSAGLQNQQGNSSGTVKKLFLSSVQNAYWSNKAIIAVPSESTESFIYNAKQNVWVLLSEKLAPDSSVKNQNGKFRVFTDSVQNKMYLNGIYVRSLSNNVLTYSLYKETEMRIDEPKKAAIVFDAMDSAEGLSHILSVLEDFNLKATFFLNGEFIRRYPAEVKQIVARGHECASSFYTTADLTAEHILVDADFIKRGLARNEDEFYMTTGKELSLLWHAPYYHETEKMKEAGKNCGYRYVKAFTGYSDRITIEMSDENSGCLYLDSGNLIEALSASLEDKMIIPVLTGKVEGTRRDYLYEKIELLIASVLESGYSISDVRSLIR